MKIEGVDVREQCRISCGADIVIEHMLPYLLPATDEIQHQPVADSDDESSISDSSFFSIDSNDSDEFSVLSFGDG